MIAVIVVVVAPVVLVVKVKLVVGDDWVVEVVA